MDVKFSINRTSNKEKVIRAIRGSCVGFDWC
jgi:hypothetical protein